MVVLINCIFLFNCVASLPRITITMGEGNKVKMESSLEETASYETGFKQASYIKPLFAYVM